MALSKNDRWVRQMGCKRSVVERAIRNSFDTNPETLYEVARRRLPGTIARGPFSFQDHHWEEREWLEALLSDRSQDSFERFVSRVPFFLLERSVALTLLPWRLLLREEGSSGLGLGVSENGLDLHHEELGPMAKVVTKTTHPRPALLS